MLSRIALSSEPVIVPSKQKVYDKALVFGLVIFTSPSETSQTTKPFAEAATASEYTFLRQVKRLISSSALKFPKRGRAAFHVT